MVRKTCWWDVPPEHAYKHRVLLISKGPYCSYHSRSRCSRKPWEGPYFPYFPYFGGPCLVILSRHGPGNRDPLSVFPGLKWPTTTRGPLFPLFWWPMSWHRDPDKTLALHQNRGNRGNRDPLMVLEESRCVCRYVLTFFGNWLVHASDVMVAMDENMYD